MLKYSIQQVAKLAGVSVRTLHYYDEIGLLSPHDRGENRYRLYTYDDLLQLQQILLYRSLDFTLDTIKKLLVASDFDLLASLRTQKQLLEERQQDFATILATVTKTITQLETSSDLVSVDDLYGGLSEAEIASQQAEVIERWGAARFKESQENVKKLTKKQWTDLQQEHEKINHNLTLLLDHDPGLEAVQTLIAAHYNYIGRFYSVTADVYLGLADLYETDTRFSAYYEKYAEGLASFLARAMRIYVERNL